MIEVLLLKDVERLGKAGEKISVKDGFARNFLVPQGFAIAATLGNKNSVAALLASRKKQAQAFLAKAEELAHRIGGVTCTLRVVVGEQGKLHGAITAADIEKWLTQQGISVEKNRMVLPSPLTKIGEYPVSIKLHPEVTAILRVQLVPQ